MTPPTAGRADRAGRAGWSGAMALLACTLVLVLCGACEKIRNTPLPSSYRALLRHGIALYLAITPFYLIEDIGLAGLPMFILAAYFLLGIELVAEEIEEPFGAGGDNLPLERYSMTIETSAREILGALGWSRSAIATEEPQPSAAASRTPGATA